MKTIKKREIDMTEGKMFRKVVAFSIPIMLSSLFQIFYNMADMIVAGKYIGDTALAAIGSTASLINLIINLFVGLSVGATVVVSQAYGARDGDRMHRATHTAILMSLCSGVFLAVFGFLFAETFIRWMDCPAEIIAPAAIYVKIYFLGMPFSMAYNYASGIMRAYGDTRQPLYFQIVAGCLNVVLNLILVVAFRMNVEGVAIATVLSQALSSVLALRSLMVVDNGCRLEWRKLRIFRKELWDIIRLGLPTGVQTVLFSISNVMIQSAINSFGSVVMAGHGAATYAMNLLSTTNTAFGSASTTISSQNFGAKKKKRILTGWLLCMGVNIAMNFSLAMLLLLVAPQFISIFTDSMETVKMGVFRMRIEAPFYCLAASIGISAGALRGIGKSMVPMIVALVGQCVLRMVWLGTLFVWFPVLECLYISYPVTWFITGGLESLLFLFFYRRLRFDTAKVTN